MTPRGPLDQLPSEDLRSLLRWLQALARRMGGDVHQADEAAQQALLKALEHAPPGGPPPRAWLAQVLKNELRMAWRGARRRRRREEASARPESVESTQDDLLHREQWRRLVRAVRRLPPPTRRVVWLRYRDGMPPRRIATHLGLSLAAVKGRLKRALAQLRRELDGESRRRGMVVWFAAWQRVPDQDADTAPSRWRAAAAACVVLGLGLGMGGSASRLPSDAAPSGVLAEVATASDAGTQRTAQSPASPAPQPRRSAVLISDAIVVAQHTHMSVDWGQTPPSPALRRVVLAALVDRGLLPPEAARESGPEAADPAGSPEKTQDAVRVDSPAGQGQRP